ncbi:site-2 protease family protein [soil metagenome]
MFRNAYRLPFRLLGIPIRLDLTFLLVLPLFVWLIGSQLGFFVALLNLPIDAAALSQGSTPFVLGFVAALGLFSSVLVHELGHSVVARRYGVEVKDITLWLLGGMAQFAEMPRQKGAEAVVAVAGPITSILLAGVFWLVLQALPAGADAAIFVVAYLAYINVVLAVFNLIPALPLDGGRILRSLLALRYGQLQATRVSAGISKFFALLLGLVGLFSFNFFLLLIAFFIYVAVSGETQYAVVTQVLEGIRVGDLMTREVIAVSPAMPAQELISKMLRERHLGYPVIDHSGRLVGMVDLEHAQDVSPETTVSEIMKREVETISPDKTAIDAFSLLSRNNYRRLVVADERDEMVGILSKTDLVRVIQVRMVGLNMNEERAGA